MTIDKRLLQFQEVKIVLPPGACPTCGGEGQEQFLDAREPEGVGARECVTCGGSGRATVDQNEG